MKTALEIGTAIVGYCRKGESMKAVENYYSKDIVSVEAISMSGENRESHGIEAVIQKSKWWAENHTVHSAKVEGPYPFDNKFSIYFVFEVTQKMTGHRITMDEIGVYTVQNGKVIREEFMYSIK